MDGKRKAALQAICSSVLFDVDMGRFSTLGTGGKASALAEIFTLKELEKLLFYLKNNDLPWRILGGGSNVLVGPSGFDGVFIRLSGDFKTIEELESSETAVFISAGAGCSLAKVVSNCVAKGLAGLEWAIGIPGTIGGAVRMNAGAFGASMADCISSIHAANHLNQFIEQTAEEVNFSYRDSLLNGETRELRYVILGAVLALTRVDKKALREKCSFWGKQRRSRQPKGVASAGSFFKNPENDAAGRLIEAAGLKGSRCGGAMVSDVHANFITNTGSATPADIIELMKKIQVRVHEDSGVWLEPEVHIIE